MGNDSVFKTLKVSSHILHKYSELLNKRADQNKTFKKCDREVRLFHLLRETL